MLSPSLWDTKRRVEADHPDFLHIDISAPDFDVVTYSARVRQLLREAGIKLEPYSITWDKITCSVPVKAPQLAISTVVSGLRSLASSVNNGFASHLPYHESTAPTSPAYVLHQASGYLKPGQMCLVLGQSGNGASLLLSRIAGRELPTVIDSSGSVLYQGQHRLAGITRPSHTVHYIGKEDSHIPELSVRHTLEFAAVCKWPDWIPFVETIRRNDVIIKARILGIEPMLETIVGSTNMPGVNDGERKRVSIGEMTIGLLCGSLVMDNWSNGLDSATTLSITQSMRKFADHLHGSVMVSMQAPGSEAFKLFDNLCILDKGRVIYFGPVSKAESYFVGLGFHRPSHRTVPDFVSTLMDPVFRGEYVKPAQPGQMPAPETTEQFCECFEKSELSTQLAVAIEEINDQPKRTLPPGSENVTKLGQKAALQSPLFQISAMMLRQKQVLLSTRRTVLQDFFQNIIFGIVLGSIFWQLPNTLGGANSRDGAVFLTVLFISLGSLSKVRLRFEEKVVFTKQKRAAFYEAWTYLLTQLCVDFLMEFVKAACLLVPLYIMAGLNIGRSAQRLLFAICVATFMSLTMLSMSRTLAALLDEPSAAQGVASFFTILMIFFSGYVKHGDEFGDWLGWIYWADPIHYALEALLINEFDGLSFNCAPEEFIPQNDAFLNASKICTVTNGTEYLSEFRGVENDKIYRLYFFLVIIGFNILFFVTSAIATTFSKPRRLASQPVNEVVPLEKGVSVDISPPKKDSEKTSFTFTDLNCSVENGSKYILSGVTGNIVGGKIVLLIGTNVVKSTLLDACAMRLTLRKGSYSSGDVRLNGRNVSKGELSRSTGYCKKNCVHIGETTVYEAVLFSAKLRLPTSVPLKEKQARTAETLALLGLEKYSSVLSKALRNEQKKLLTIALEVVANPKVLFLNEPTSGISSSGTITVANALRKIADSGTAVICTFQQSSAEIFSQFDRVLILKRGGKTVYFGDIGEDADVLQSYFESRGGRKMKKYENIVSWMMDVIGDDSINWPELWAESDERKKRDEETRDLANLKVGDAEHESEKFEMPSTGSQVREVIRRQFWVYWRKPSYNGTRVFLNLMLALLVGILFLREVNNTQNGARLALSTLFLTLIPASLLAQNVIPTTIEGRNVFYREVASGTYRPIAYHAAVGIVEIPFTVFSTTVYAVIVYFMTGLDPRRFHYFFIAIQLLYILAVNFGIMLASILPSAPIAANIGRFIFLLCQVLSGFFIRKPHLRPWWSWTTWINPLNYYLAGMLVNQYSGKAFTCKGNEIEIPLPDGYAVCEEISSDFFTLPDKDPTSCYFCAMPNGEAVIQRYGADGVNKWVRLLVLAAAIVLCRVVAGYGLRNKRFTR